MATSLARLFVFWAPFMAEVFFTRLSPKILRTKGHTSAHRLAFLPQQGQTFDPDGTIRSVLLFVV